VTLPRFIAVLIINAANNPSTMPATSQTQPGAGLDSGSLNLRGAACGFVLAISFDRQSRHFASIFAWTLLPSHAA
jgi:hypothetical protein